jgi:hypothetical protein
MVIVPVPRETAYSDTAYSGTNFGGHTTMRQLAFLIVLVFALGTSAWPQANRPVAARVAASSAVSATPNATMIKQMDELSADSAQLDESHARTVKASEGMSQIHSALSSKVGSLCNSAEKARVSPAEVAKALDELCDTNRNSSTQYLQLQTAMQQDNRQYTTVSNVLKTKHDTVKNSINNIR